MPAKTRAAQDRLRPAGGELVTCAELPAREEVPGYPVRAEGRVGWARPPEACTQLERAAVSASSTDTGIALLKVTVSLSWPSLVKAPPAARNQPRGIGRGLPPAPVPPAAHAAAAAPREKKKKEDKTTSRKRW